MTQSETPGSPITTGPIRDNKEDFARWLKEDMSLRTCKTSVYKENQIPVTLEFTDVRCSIPERTRAGGWLWRKGKVAAGGRSAEDKVILHSISGIARPGDALAIMGPSGSGKSTLLNVLCGRWNKKMGGIVQLNGHDRNKVARKITAYVMQKDIFFGEFTVFQTLRYTALLRLGKSMTYKEKMAKVERVIAIMGLECCRNTIVGTVMQRGISGGELKRLNVACELLLSPSIFVLDEPTSGLDSNGAALLISCLRTLAETSNITVICAIHQPSSQTFEKFNRLILMSQGRIIYQGQVSQVAGYFQSVGFPCPPNYNIADHLSDLSNDSIKAPFLLDTYAKCITRSNDGEYYLALPSDPLADAARLSQEDPAEELHWGETEHDEGVMMQSSNSSSEGQRDLPVVVDCCDSAREQSLATTSATPHRILATEEGEATNSKRRQQQHRRESDEETTAESFSRYPSLKRSRSRLLYDGLRSSASRLNVMREFSTTDPLTSLIHSKADPPAYFTQVYWLFRRCFWREFVSSFGWVDNIQFLCIALICGGIWFQLFLEHSEAYVEGMMGCIYFAVIFWSFYAQFPVLTHFYPDSIVIAKERSSKAYPLSVYMIASGLAQLLVGILCPTLFFIVVYALTGMPGTVGNFMGAWGVLMLVVATTISLAELISSLARNLSQSLLLSALYTFAAMLVSGVWVKQEHLNEVVSWFSWCSHTVHGANGISTILLEGHSFECATHSSFDVCPIPGRMVLDSFFVNKLNLLQNVGALCGMIVVSKLLTYLRLRFGPNLKMR